MTIHGYLVVIESGPQNLSAYIPDLPGCVTTGATAEEVMTNMREAVALHIKGMREDGESIPLPTSIAGGYVTVKKTGDIGGRL